MQTFLPYSSFELSAKCLDSKRLGKQRVEAKQILKSIRTGTGWFNHPAVQMWIGYEKALIQYYNICVDEWLKRGFNSEGCPKIGIVGRIAYPPWLKGRIHTTHRSALLFKDLKFYSSYGWKEIPGRHYYWPSQVIK